MLLVLATAPGAVDAQPAPTAEPPPYQRFRFDEDYAYLADPARRTDPWDPLKYIPLDERGEWRLSLGGEARERFEYYDNYRWNPDASDQDGYLLQRYLLHADLRMGAAFRVFAQLQTSLEDWREGGPRPVDENRTDIHQLFADVRLLGHGGGDRLTLRVGRQEMAFGSQRLVSVRESPNVRRAFDAVHLLAAAGDWRVDAFASRPVEDDRGSFDDWGDAWTTFWGVLRHAPPPGAPRGQHRSVLPGAEPRRRGVRPGRRR